MNPDIDIVEVEETTIAAVAGQITFADIPAKMMPMMDQVWAFIRSHEITHGHNVWLYRPASDGTVNVEVGVQLPADDGAAPCPKEQGDVQYFSTPGGRAAHTVYYGEYEKLPQVHQALMDWCAAQGHALAGVDWEVYGDWHEDAAKRRTDVYYLLEP